MRYLSAVSHVTVCNKERSVRLLIAIPVYNERKYVQTVLDQVKRFHDDILIIDDGSTDGTGEVLAGRSDIHLIRHAVNRGYGQSLIDAFRYADRHGYDWVITMDCDEQHEPEMIPEFIRQIESDEWDVVSGSRYLETMQGDDLPPGDRRAINAAITAILNDLFGWGLTDSFCGFKAHRVSAMRKLNLTETGYAFPLQFWPQVYEHGLRVKEIAVRLIYNDPTRHFGGLLDDAAVRLQHYKEVLNAELRRMKDERARRAEAVEASSCGETSGGAVAVDQPAICSCFCGE
jgi:dolichol-phosphate mannosyltransferase